MAGKRAWNRVTRATVVMTPAELNTYFSDLDSALTEACGLVRTDHPGQLQSFAGLVVPAASSVSNYGYRVYRLEDLDLDMPPVYLRVIFSAFANGSAVAPRLDFQLSMAISPAGVPMAPVASCASGTGLAIAKEARYPYTFADAAAQPAGLSSRSLACGGSGFFWLVLGVDGVVANTNEGANSINSWRPVAGDRYPFFFIVVSRTVDEAGDFTASGFTAYSYQAIRFSGEGPEGTIISGASIGSYGGLRISNDAIVDDLASSQGATRDGVLVLRNVFMPATSQVALPTPVIGAVDALSLPTEEVLTDVALVGDRPRTYIHPSRCLAPLERGLPGTRHRLSPILLWEGPTV